MGVFRAEFCNTHDEIFAVDTEQFTQRQVFVDVLTEFACLAFNADRYLAIDQHEYVKLIAFLVLQGDF